MMNKRIRPGRAAFMSAGVMVLLLVLLALPVVTNSAPAHQAIQQWTSVASLPEAYIPEAVAVVAGSQRYLFLVGGKNAALNPVTTVRRALINADGSLGNWQNTVALPEPIYSHAAVTSNDGRFLYVLGGWNGSARVSAVRRTTIGADGSLSGWISVTSLPEVLAQHAAVVVGNRIYVIGGQNSTAVHNKVYMTTILADGTLSGWTSITALPQALDRLSAVAFNGFFYVTGGSSSNSTALDTVYYSRINSNGTLAGWQTGQLPSARYYHQAIIHDNRLVILGGTSNNTSGINQVWSSTINAGGWLDGWQAEPALPKALYRMASVTVRINGSDTIYVLGGLQGTAYQASVYRSAIAPTPTFTPTFTPTATATPVATPGLSTLSLRNDPYTQMQAGGQIRYTISYRNGPIGVTQFDITNIIPQSTSLVVGSISNGGTSTGSGAGNLVRWRLGSLAGNATGYVSYLVTANALENTENIEAGVEISRTVTISSGLAAPDLAVITNVGATASWLYATTTDQMTSNGVVNPSKRRFLPLMIRQR